MTWRQDTSIPSKKIDQSDLYANS